MPGKSKIICTLGPATRSVEMLVGLINAGMDVARLNFSHGTHDEHLQTIHNLREAIHQTGESPAILGDLQGPKIRIGTFRTPSVELQAGNRFTITTKPVEGDERRVGTTFAGLTADVHPGDIILIDDGKLRLRALEIEEQAVHCEVVVGGTLSAHKGINLPGVAVSAPSLTGKDLKDLEFGIANDVDFVALSFVRTVADIRALRAEIAGRLKPDRYLPVIAKIEKSQAVADIDAIIAEADGIMIARGDLGVEMPAEDVPMLQKMIIRKCNQAGKPVIIATQMLESMIGNPAPTRAEASDVANAVLDGGDALMLSAETSVGRYPLEAVRIMNRIIQRVESGMAGSSPALHRTSGMTERRIDALGHAACVLAEQMGAAAIVIVTRSGQTARVVSRYRPHVKIVAVTDRPEILRRMSLLWGIRGLVIEGEKLNSDSDRAMEVVQNSLRSSGLVKSGEHFVVLAGQPFLARGSTNFIKVEKME